MQIAAELSNKSGNSCQPAAVLKPRQCVSNHILHFRSDNKIQLSSQNCNSEAGEEIRVESHRVSVFSFWDLFSTSVFSQQKEMWLVRLVHGEL